MTRQIPKAGRIKWEEASSPRNELILSSRRYECSICGKLCKTDKLGYEQGMFSLWKYGSHHLVSQTNIPARGVLCTPCLTTIMKTVNKLGKVKVEPPTEQAEDATAINEELQKLAPHRRPL